jgi:hypothetical protein
MSGYLRFICCIAASLALMGLPAAPAAVATYDSTAMQMPCDGDMPEVPGHRTDCSLGCDSAPADNQLGPDWAPPASRPVFKDFSDMLAPAAFPAAIAPTADPHYPQIARAPPPFTTDSPVTRADRLLN